MEQEGTSPRASMLSHDHRICCEYEHLESDGNLLALCNTFLSYLARAHDIHIRIFFPNTLTRLRHVEAVTK